MCLASAASHVAAIWRSFPNLSRSVFSPSHAQRFSMLVSVRQPGRRTHRIEIQDEIAMQRTGDAAADIEENTRRLLKAVEDIVRSFPEQFLWTHRRYRTRPIRGTPSVYDI